MAAVETTERAQPAPIAAAGGTDDADTGVLEVLVVDAADRPLPNVPISVQPLRADCDPQLDTRFALTGFGGVCEFVVEQPGVFVVHALGGLGSEVAVTAGARVRVELRMAIQGEAPQRTVRGRVVTAARQPVPFAEILVSYAAAQVALPAGAADADGAFELVVVSDVLLVGARAALAAPSDLVSCRPERELLLVLPGPCASVAGIVLAADGAPVAGAAVRIGRPRGEAQWIDQQGVMNESPRPDVLRTDADGRFVATGLRRAELQLEVLASGHAPLRRYVDTRRGDLDGLILQLDGGLVLRGRVIDADGAAIGGARVQLGGTYGESRTTGVDGRFVYRSVAAVPTQLHVEVRGAAPVHVERDLAHDATEWVVVVARWPEYVLRLVDESGVPLSGWRVVVGEADHAEVAADADGRVRVRLDGTAAAALAVGPPGRRVSVAVALPPGATPGVEATIVIPASAMPSATISAELRAADGTVPEQVRVALFDGKRSLGLMTLDAGRYTSPLLPPGDYGIVVHSAGHGSTRFAVSALRAGERRDAGVLRLPAEGTLLLHVVAADGSAPRSAAVFLYDAEGRELFAPPLDGAPHPWPIGRYDYLVMEDASLWQRGSVEVRAGEPSAIDVVLRPAVRRKLAFPVPTPAWGAPERVDFVLRAPDGSVYDRGDFDPGEELPYRYCPPLDVGVWRVELQLDDGRWFAGAFEVADLSPVLEELRLAVEPVR